MVNSVKLTKYQITPDNELLCTTNLALTKIEISLSMLARFICFDQRKAKTNRVKDCQAEIHFVVKTKLVEHMSILCIFNRNLILFCRNVIQKLFFCYAKS
jgi:hypothetical protein